MLFNELYWYYIPYRGRSIRIMKLIDGVHPFYSTECYSVKYIFRKNKKTLYKVIKKTRLARRWAFHNDIWKFYTDGTIVKHVRVTSCR